MEDSQLFQANNLFEENTYNSIQSNFNYEDVVSHNDSKDEELKVYKLKKRESTPNLSLNNKKKIESVCYNVDGINLSQSQKKKRAVREDVMNKNILRLMRRQCRQLYAAFCQTNNVKMIRRNGWFISTIKDFAHFLLYQNLDTSGNDLFLGNDFNSFIFTPDDDNFIMYLGIFVDYCTMKRILSCGTKRSKLLEINDVLYNFTQTKFYDFIAIPEVKSIINLIWKMVDIKSVISQNKSLKIHQDDYEDHISALFTH